MALYGIGFRLIGNGRAMHHTHGKIILVATVRMNGRADIHLGADP